MKKISVYFISTVLSGIFMHAMGQDTIQFPLKMKIGADIFGPASYFTDNNTLAVEGFFSIDRDTSKALVVEAGYLKFRYSQYNYDFKSQGGFIKLGVDFNLLSPKVSKGRYYAGVGLRYGLGIFRYEVPYYEHGNYWGTFSGQIPSTTHMAHFLEVSPGIRSEILKNISIGWAVRLRLLVYSGTGRDLKAIYIPGFGNGSKAFSPGFSYYLIFNIPIRTVEVR